MASTGSLSPIIPRLCIGGSSRADRQRPHMAAVQQQPPPAAVPSSPSRPPISLQPSHNKRSSGPSSKPAAKLFRRFRSVFRSFPIITPTACKMPSPPGARSGDHGHHHVHGATRMTGTIFGYRKSRVNLAIQENPRRLPTLVLELAIPTGKLLQDMGTGLVRIALECEKRGPSEKMRIVEEPIWTLYCNGRKSGYAVRREPTDDDLTVMQLLHAVSMGAGVLPSDSMSEAAAAADAGELTYLRAHFERVVGSKDSETYHMMSPDSNNGTELSIFFVRI